MPYLIYIRRAGDGIVEQGILRTKDSTCSSTWRMFLRNSGITETSRCNAKIGQYVMEHISSLKLREAVNGVREAGFHYEMGPKYQASKGSA